MQLIALILIVCSLAVPVICLIKMYMIKKFKQNAIVTEAVITNTEKRWGYKGGAAYYIFSLQYKVLQTGALFTEARAISRKYLKPGDRIPLMYLADNPAQYKTDFSKKIYWVFGFSLIFLGLIIWFCYWLLNIKHY